MSHPWLARAAVLLLSGAAGAAIPVRAPHAMVVSEEPVATEIGVAVLREGGNAVDAAVAIGFALAVNHPSAGNLGGGGFLLLRLADGTSTFLDFRERAPAAATRNMYLDAKGNLTRDSVVGYRACGVPGTVLGLETAHRHWGKMPWSRLIEPATRMARDGFPVTAELARGLNRASGLLSGFADSKRIFVKDAPGWQLGDVLRQPDLAATLQRIANDGSKDFYHGETARRLAEFERQHAGPITLDDLEHYQVVERQPLHGAYKAYELITAPPPSSGGVALLQTMGMLGGSGYDVRGAGSARALHWEAEAMRRAYADRSKWLADPDFYAVPLNQLLDRAYLKQRRASITARASRSSQIGPGVFANLPPLPAKTGSRQESHETTNYIVVDAAGNAVVVTYTLNAGFGSGVTAGGLGFLLNDEMDDFSAKPGTPNLFGLVQGEANSIAPAKRPLSSMTPTIVVQDGRFALALGAPGGGQIISGVIQVLLNVLDFGMNVADATAAPRIHHQWRPDVLRLERSLSPDTVALLKARGHQLELVESHGARVSAVAMVAGGLEGAHDPRADGKAAGY